MSARSTDSRAASSDILNGIPSEPTRLIIFPAAAAVPPKKKTFFSPATSFAADAAAGGGSLLLPRNRRRSLLGFGPSSSSAGVAIFHFHSVCASSDSLHTASSDSFPPELARSIFFSAAAALKKKIGFSPATSFAAGVTSCSVSATSPSSLTSMWYSKSYDPPLQYQAP